jgi:hypothetical protein
VRLERVTVDGHPGRERASQPTHPPCMMQNVANPLLLREGGVFKLQSALLPVLVL